MSEPYPSRSYLQPDEGSRPSMAAARRPFDGRVPPPEFAGIQTTSFCNLRCRMCILFHNGTTVTGPHMGLDVFTEVAEQVFPFVKRWQPTVSGEPAMSKGFFQMLRLASEFGVKADITTNGTLLSKNTLDALIPGAGVITISFDAPDAETFEFIREGADYYKVIENIKTLVKRCREELPDDQQPDIGFSCTLMEKNIRGLANLVELASELGLDYVSVTHVYPVTEEIKQQSLVHYQDLAREEIDKALEKAEEVGIAFSIMPLDRITAEMASSSDAVRSWTSENGNIKGFDFQVLNASRRRPFPELKPGMPDYEEVHQRRLESQKNFSFPPRREVDPEAPDRGSIWYCEYLWNKIYINVDKSVAPCCVPDTPIVGHLGEARLDEVWNNENLRSMRQRLVMKDPVPVCRGCMHIQEISDPAAVDLHLQGMDIPSPQEAAEIPARLDPKQTLASRALDRPDTLVAIGKPKAVEAESPPEIFGRIHPRDPLLSGATPGELEHYRRAGLEAYGILEKSMLLANRALQGASVLEYGCGYGRVTRCMAQQLGAQQITVCDMDPGAVAFCEEEFGVQAFPVNGDRKTASPSVFDLVWINSGFIWQNEVLIKEMLDSIDKVLAASGVLIFATFGEQSLRLLQDGIYGESYRERAPAVIRSVEEEGSCFIPAGFEGDAQTGMMWVRESYVKDLMAGVFGDGLELVKHDPKGWDNHLDIFVYQRPPRSASEPVRQA